MFGLFKKSYGGLVAGMSLAEWWRQSFSESEKSVVRDTLDKSMGTFVDFDSGPARHYHQPTKIMLASISEWFTKDDVRQIGRRFMAKAETYDDKGISVIDRHFMLTGMVRFYYRCRGDGPEFLPLCETRCRDMIAISKTVAAMLKREFPQSELPSHLGYGRLSWLLRKSNPADAARLRAEGEAQGWTVSI